jgi:hypothetical protein
MVKIVVRDTDDEVPAGTVFLSQDEARRRLGEDHIDIRPISGTLQDIADNTPAVLRTDGRWSPALVEGLIAAVDDFEGARPATAASWKVSVRRAADAWPQDTQQLSDILRSARERGGEVTWQEVRQAAGSRRGTLGAAAQGLRAMVAQRGGVAGLDDVQAVLAGDDLVRHAVKALLASFLTNRRLLTKSSLRDMIDLKLVRTGIPERRQGRHPLSSGVDLADVRLLAARRRRLTYTRTPESPQGELAIACPVTDDINGPGGFILSKWPALVGAESFQRPDIRLGAGVELAGFLEIADHDVDRLIDENGVLLPTIGGFVTSAWQVLSLVGRITYRRRAVLAVRRLPVDREAQWLGYVPRMPPKPSHVHRPAWTRGAPITETVSPRDGEAIDVDLLPINARRGRDVLLNGTYVGTVAPLKGRWSALVAKTRSYDVRATRQEALEMIVERALAVRRLSL